MGLGDHLDTTCKTATVLICICLGFMGLEFGASVLRFRVEDLGG